MPPVANTPKDASQTDVSASFQRILILGSAPNSVEAANWPRDLFDKIVVINNAWRIRDDWDDIIYPYDFAAENMPAQIKPHQQVIDEDAFVPIQNDYGGFVYAGATMAYTAGYWVLGHYQPAQIIFMGCDMHYPDTGNTHFYGNGTPDPLRDDITLTSLEASSARLYSLAAQQGCQLFNLSDSISRLIFPRISISALASHDTKAPEPAIDKRQIAIALNREAELDYYVPNGRYWENSNQFDKDALIQLDALWMKTIKDTSQEISQK
ncbi:hypothetical protein [Candidatus Puniceispirillum sp.]|uniref:hypothetical protein n=1 Tax=Candidatus Puniceispirillum sp. TaxID=2026719 RepID=UPI001EB8E3B1|nr:hypothetical protein [Candidatus Puniceispirillum sp.]